ncbi:hypothetical protein ELY21_00710 [Legionella sp. km535]|uniref:hypothetical protein n=1 Tax=Legionella sp. km535 TaxID=2498107 RepID=UPI000F8D04F1|nr:hypothetical protein [Legionella sp. km535]RUR20639.1 hypothetical protein ELY21_00710 [Legionella sp. km535]
MAFLKRMILILLFPIGSVNSAHYLTTSEIKTLLSGHSSVFFGNHGGVKFTGYGCWNKNGSIYGYTYILGKKRNWTGTWYIKNNQYCRTLNAYGKSQFRCLRVQQINTNTIRFIKSDGSISSTSKLQ